MHSSRKYGLLSCYPCSYFFSNALSVYLGVGWLLPSQWYWKIVDAVFNATSTNGTVLLLMQINQNVKFCNFQTQWSLILIPPVASTTDFLLLFLLPCEYRRFTASELNVWKEGWITVNSSLLVGSLCECLIVIRHFNIMIRKVFLYHH